MGWTFGWEKPTNLKESILEMYQNPQENEPYIIDHKSTNFSRHWWVLFQRGEKKFIVLYLIAKHGEGPWNWGYKDMSEDMGPCYYDCPLSLLDQSEPINESAERWREKVREYHKGQKVDTTDWEPGTVIRLGQWDMVLERKRKRSWLARYGGCLYRIGPNQFKNCEVIHAV